MAVLARIVVLLVVGLLLAAAYLQTTAGAPQAARTRAALADDAREQAARTDELQREAAALRARLSKERARELANSTAGGQAQSRVQGLEVATGLVALRGSGIVVVVGDATNRSGSVTGSPAPADPDGAGRVQDRDLTDIVNALWAAGAEAISVDGQRLSPTSTIRAAGDAILVDFRPVSSPYEIRAIGDAGRMQVRFADSPIARSFATFVQLYGMRFSIRRASQLTVPAAPGTDLKFASPGASER